MPDRPLRVLLVDDHVDVADLSDTAADPDAEGSGSDGPTVPRQR